MDTLKDCGNVIFEEKGGLKYLRFRNLDKYCNIITHCFTTRIGGVSTGECSALNFGFNRNDTKENVKENFRRLCSVLNIDINNLVLSNQVHGNKVKVVCERDRGKGISRKSDIVGYDALITNKKKVPIVTFYADCVPVLLFDSEKTVIGTAHSGWRGTALEVAGEAIRSMIENFGSSPDDIEAVIGPSIGKCCFETGEEVYNHFRERINWSESFCTKAGNGKWYIDLQRIIKNSLLNMGLSEHKILVSNICTKCNKHLFFSHRGDCGKTGCMAAVMQIN
ncbi:MAG: peptidoglycan editing factor PgeF [Acetivibrionales bacterium]